MGGMTGFAVPVGWTQLIGAIGEMAYLPVSAEVSYVAFFSARKRVRHPPADQRAATTLVIDNVKVR